MSIRAHYAQQLANFAELFVYYRDGEEQNSRQIASSLTKLSRTVAQWSAISGLCPDYVLQTAIEKAEQYWQERLIIAEGIDARQARLMSTPKAPKGVKPVKA